MVSIVLDQALATAEKQRLELDNGYYLLTGATGLLGQAILRLALADDRPIAVLVRSRGSKSARHRIDAIIARWEEQMQRWLPRPVVLEGDLEQPQCAIGASQRAWIAAHCGAAIHSAASLMFDAAPGGEPWLTNVDGTRHVLELCRQTGIDHFFHVSTAYVCGQRTGTVLETELDVGQTLANDYERSKLEAERLVRAATHLRSSTIFRPSIVVGDSRTGETPTFHGFYRPLQAVISQRDRASRSSGVLQYLQQLGLSGGELKNLVPVDWVAATISAIIANPSAHGQSYHLTNEHCVTVREIAEATAEAIAQAGHARSAGTSGRGGQPSSASFAEQLQCYAAYFRDDAQFDRANLLRVPGNVACPALTHETLVMLARYALQVNFGWPRPAERAPQLDVEAALATGGLSRQSSLSAAGLGFDVLGPGGGCWEIAFAGEKPVSFAQGHSGRESARATIDVETLRSLLVSKHSLSDAIHAGQLLIEAPAGRTDTAVERLAALLMSLTRNGRKPEHAPRPKTRSSRSPIHAS